MRRPARAACWSTIFPKLAAGAGQAPTIKDAPPLIYHLSGEKAKDLDVRARAAFASYRNSPARPLGRATFPAGSRNGAGTVPPAFCVVAQGAKVVMLGSEVFSYDASRMFAYTVDLPIAGQVVRASVREPFLAFVLRFDPVRIAELVLKVFPHGVPSAQESRAIIVGRTSPSITDAAARLVESMAQPAEAELVAPLIVDEIFTRLLLSSIGPRVAQLGQNESAVRRVATAVSWVREHFAQPVKLEALADMVHMSVSSFHQHFKAVTSMTPLPYQKLLRLQEARRLMLSRMVDAGSAAREVGYLSPAQFSREYARERLLMGRAQARTGHVSDGVGRW